MAAMERIETAMHIERAVVTASGEEYDEVREVYLTGTLYQPQRDVGLMQPWVEFECATDADGGDVRLTEAEIERAEQLLWERM